MWGHFAPFTNQIQVFEENQTSGLQTHWDSNLDNNNLCAVIYNNSIFDPISPRYNLGNGYSLSHDNVVNIEDRDCDSLDSESSIDDDEEAYHRRMMEDTEENHVENESMSMDFTEYSGEMGFKI